MTGRGKRKRKPQNGRGRGNNDEDYGNYGNYNNQQQHFNNKRSRSKGYIHHFNNKTPNGDFNVTTNNPFNNSFNSSNPTHKINNWQIPPIIHQIEDDFNQEAAQNNETFLNTTIADNSTERIRLAILPKHYPTTTLTNDELSKLEDAIVDEIKLGWETKIMFDDIHFRSSLLLIDCASQETADWLLRSATKLKSWNGPKLRVCKENELPQWFYIKVNFPKSAEQDPGETLALLDAQNVGLNVKLWKLLTCEKNENVQLLTLAIDENSKNTIVTSGYTMRYRFGKVFVFDVASATENSLPVTEIPAADISAIQSANEETSSIKQMPIGTTPKVTIKKILDKKI